MDLSILASEGQSILRDLWAETRGYRRILGGNEQVFKGCRFSGYGIIVSEARPVSRYMHVFWEIDVTFRTHRSEDTSVC